MSKAPFIHPEWQRLLEQASRFVPLVEHFDRRLLDVEKYVMASIEDLKREVAENTSVVGSAVALISGLRDKLQEANDAIAAGSTPDYAELVAELDKAQADLAAAMATNTAVDPAAPADVVEPPFEPAPVEPVVADPAAEPQP